MEGLGKSIAEKRARKDLEAIIRIVSRICSEFEDVFEAISSEPLYGDIDKEEIHKIWADINSPKDAEIAKKDAEIAEKDEEIKRLTAVLQEYNDNCLEALRSTLEKYFSKNVYGINVFKEDAICIENVYGHWCVYYGMRGQKDQPELLNNVVSAGDRLLYRISTDGDEYNEMREYFHENCRTKNNVKRTYMSYGDQMDAISAAFQREIDELESLPPEEAKKKAKENLVKIGLIDDDGNLTEPYRKLRDL